MTMQVKITKEYNDSYQARVRTVNTYADEVGGQPVDHTADVALLKKAGDEFSTYCTSTQRIEIVEEALVADEA